MANDPNWEKEEDGEFKNGGICEQHNAIIGGRFEFKATKAISIGDEILLHYDLSINY